MGKGSRKCKRKKECSFMSSLLVRLEKYAAALWVFEKNALVLRNSDLLCFWSNNLCICVAAFDTDALIGAK